MLGNFRFGFSDLENIKQAIKNNYTKTFHFKTPFDWTNWGSLMFHSSSLYMWCLNHALVCRLVNLSQDLLLLTTIYLFCFFYIICSCFYYFYLSCSLIHWHLLTCFSYVAIDFQSAGSSFSPQIAWLLLFSQAQDSSWLCCFDDWS